MAYRRSASFGPDEFFKAEGADSLGGVSAHAFCSDYVERGGWARLN